MFEQLERQQKLTLNQWKIIIASLVGGMFEFFDFFLIGYVLAFILVPWKLGTGPVSVILLSTGLGAIAGAFACGYLADKFGRRIVFIGTILLFSLSTGILAFTPEGSWEFLSFFRFLVGFGVAGMLTVDLPLVQEFVPSSKRGMVGGLIFSSQGLGVLLGSLATANFGASLGWRGLFIIGALPALLVLAVRSFVPESPRWLIKVGRPEQVRRSLAWALQIDPAEVILPSQEDLKPRKVAWKQLFRYPRLLSLVCFGTLGVQTGYYGITLWAPSLLGIILKIKPAEAAALMIPVSLSGITGRLVIAWMSDKFSRRKMLVVLYAIATVLLIATAYSSSLFIGSVSVFWLMLIVSYLFVDGPFGISNPYYSENWPSDLRASGLGFGNGIGGLGKILGPVGLALIVGSSNLLSPEVKSNAALPAFIFMACAYAFSCLAVLIFGIETKGRTLEEIEAGLEKNSEAAEVPKVGIAV